MSNIAFIGLGNMGSGMCANLAKAGHQVHAFDLNTKSIENAVHAGALAATSIAECVRDAEFVITMLPAGKHVHAVYFDDDGVLAHAKAGLASLYSRKQSDPVAVIRRLTRARVDLCRSGHGREVSKMLRMPAAN